VSFLIYSGKRSDNPCAPALVVLGPLPSTARSFTKVCQTLWKTTPALAAPKNTGVVVFSILYLEDGDDGPEQGVEVLPVGQRVTVSL